MSLNSNSKRKSGTGAEETHASKKHAKQDQNQSGSADVHLGALKYIPHAIYKLLENIPQPWESEKEVSILRHTQGAITFVNEIPKTSYTEYTSQWSQAIENMRVEQQDRAEFRRMRVPAFDDEEPVQDYRKLTKLVPKPPTPVPLIKKGKSKYDQLNSVKECFLPNNIQNQPPFMDFNSLVTSKALPAPLNPFGPVFNSPKKADELPPSSVDNPDIMIIRPRQAMRRPESRIAYPHLYGGVPDLPRDIMPPASLNCPVNALITRKDGKVPFFVDKAINDTEYFEEIGDGDDNNTPLEHESYSKPFLSNAPSISPELVAQNLVLYNAPYPFNQVSEKRIRRQDVALVKKLYTNRLPPRSAKNATRSGYKRLLKRTLYRKIKTMKSHGGYSTHSSRKNLLHFLSQTPFFDKSKATWLEVGLEVCRQGHKTLLLMIHKRGLHFIHLDYNFNLKPTRTLSTKERKRSRFGHSFHIVRELLRLLKLVVDCHVQFKLGNVDAYELADGLGYIFSNVGQLTGIYRYKYKVMHQITECTDLKNVICDKLRMDDLGCGVWQPMWRVWISFVRGIIPMLERWLGNLLSRQIYGRVSKGIRHTVTKQRIDSQYDLELRAAAMHDILDAMPMELRKSKSQIVMQHLSEAWRCWKADVEYDMSMLPSTAKVIVDRYIKARSENWMRGAKITRDKIQNLGNVDSAIARKNVNRLTRLYMREQRLFSSNYTAQGPSLTPQEAVSVYKTVAEYVQQKGISRIEFPETDDPLDTSFLAIAIDHLRNEVSGAQSTRLTRTQQEGIQLLDTAADSPFEAISKIKRALRTRRVFSDIEISLRDDHTKLVPVFEVPLEDKLTDAYLSQYIWFNVRDSELFPSFVKPCDEEIAPVTARRFCEALNNDTKVWETKGARTVLMHANVEKFVKNVDLTLLNKLLRLVLDPTLADYMTSRMNVTLNFKDMSYVNHLGIITGIPFAPFMIQYYLLAIDLLLLGLPRVLSLDSNQHPIRTYLRFEEDVYIVIHLTESQCEEVIEDYTDSAQNIPYKRCWPINLSPRMVKSNTVASKCLCQEFNSRLPPSLGTLDWVETSCLSIENPALHFELAGFEIRLTKEGTNSNSFLHSDSSWLLVDSASKRRTGLALLRVADSRINQFAGMIRQLLMSSGSSSFQRTIERWNRTVTAFVSYFREALSATPKALSILERCELQVQNKIKMALNSKMPTRFPPCVFYTSTELGGLGMLSVSKVIVPEEDSYVESYIPNVLRYIRPWETEIADSERAWNEFKDLKLEADQNNESLDYESVEHLVDRGLPRIGTIFSKDRNLMELDVGFRMQFRSSTKRDLFYWTNRKHDGKLYDLQSYRDDVLKSLGGVNTVLGHTLFAATGFESYESLFWQKQSALEQQLAQQKLTNAQRTGMSQIPNRRFTLWWSPTINRANVYVGFLVQLDLTGIFLHGKIPTLKVSYVQLFRAHLWQKIHESVVLDLCRVIDKENIILHVDGVQKLLVHPRKSYRMNASAADILITSAGTDWSLSKPSSITDPDNYDETSLISQSQFWIDVQLKYGDFDAHDTAKYARAKFLDYTNDGVSLYPSKFGLVVCIDLAYNTFSAFGYWFPGLKQLLQSAMKKIMQSNPALYVLRERIRRALQLHSGKPAQSLPASDFTDLCNQNTMLVDASDVYNVRTYRTKNGNTANRPEDGSLACFQPINGIVTLTFIPSSTWAGQKRLSAVSKWKSAELTADVIRKFSTDKPSSVVINTPALKDPFEVNMLEFENMSVSLTDMHLPFSSILKLPPVLLAFKNISNNSQEDNTFTVNLYDDWLLTLQPHTAFARLMVILRGLESNPTEVEGMFSVYPKEDGYIWPKISSEAWIEVEERITDLIIADYAQSHGIRASSLTPSKIRDVILGKKIDDEVIEELEKINSSGVDATGGLEMGSTGNVVTSTVESHNIHGDRITVVTSSVYEQHQFNSQTSWQTRALVCTNRGHLLNHQFALSTSTASSDRVLIWSQNLLDEFVAISDIRNTVMALAYAKADREGDRIVKRVECLAVVPQLGSRTHVSFCNPMNIAPDLELIGYIRVSTGEPTDSVPPLDLSLLAKLGPNLTATVLCYEGSRINVETYRPSDAGLEFGSQNRDLISPNPPNYSASYAERCHDELDPSDSSSSYFLVPDDDVWNYAFMSILWNDKIPAIMKVANPVGYYDSIHRPNHFLSFQRLETVEDCNPLDTENEFN